MSPPKKKIILEELLKQNYVSIQNTNNLMILKKGREIIMYDKSTDSITFKHSSGSKTEGSLPRKQKTDKYYLNCSKKNTKDRGTFNQCMISDVKCKYQKKEYVFVPFLHIKKLYTKCKYKK